MNNALSVVLIGVGATIFMDLWTLLRKFLFGVPLANYGLVGRWVAHMPHGQFTHKAIGNSPAVNGEQLIGWLVHYFIGIAFAALLIVIVGPQWLQQPSPLPAIAFGVVTVIAPFFIMQPGMGAGIAASNTPNPNAARLQSTLTHTLFGVGLYVSAQFLLAF